MEKYFRRVEKLQQLMFENEIDYVILGPSTNMYYYTGLITAPDERLQVVMIPYRGVPILILPEMYNQEAGEKKGPYHLLLWPDGKDPYEMVHAVIGEGSFRIAIDPKIQAGHFFGIMEPCESSEFVDAQKTLINEMRIYKDAQELELMKKVGQLADRVMDYAAKRIRPGITEKQLAGIIENRILALGADSIPTPNIVSSGPNSSEPHHAPENRQFSKGDLIMVGFCANLDGYCTDMTRTFSLGSADSKARSIYSIIKKANEIGFKAVREGSTCQDVDRATRRVIIEAGYGEHFIHRTGHGIGLEIHEEPYLVEGNTELLAKGMVFSIEPGIYLLGEMGVRIEDTVAITDEGPIRLHSFSRELIEI